MVLYGLLCCILVGPEAWVDNEIIGFELCLELDTLKLLAVVLWCVLLAVADFGVDDHSLV